MHALTAVHLWTLGAVAAAALQPITRLRRSGPYMQIGDLEGGLNPERNAALEALKRSYLLSSADTAGDSADADTAAQLGLLLDVPVCRWSFNILPHHRTVLNVHQAQYTLAFEKLLATPQPWLYAHVMLPGGLENLADPAYALEPGSSAPLHGTIMQVVAVQREQDARLTLLVQGLSRAIVLRATQSLPYARADMQLLPDDEQLLASARRVARFLHRDASAAATPPPSRVLRRRLLLAAAAAEESQWRAYENANLTLSQHLSLSQPDGQLAEGSKLGEAAVIDDALRQQADGSCDAAEEASDALYKSCAPVIQALERAIDAAVEEDGEADARELAAATASLEVQCWLELDRLLSSLATLRGPASKAPVPSQLLGLLPPPPTGGWPEGFALKGVHDQLMERYRGAAAEGEVAAAASVWSFVPIDHEFYPARRRAQRLSYAIWAVIGGQGVELQPLVEAESANERLRMALRRIRNVMEELSTGSDA